MSDAAQRREELKAVWEQASTCQKCPQLASTRQTVVFGAGNADADLMFVGEAPGAREDERGLPFVGQAGRLLEQLLGEIGLQRADVFIANVLKCRPPGNRDPLPQEIDACQDYLFRQLELIRPKVVCSLGNFSTKLLRGDPTGITRLHGRDEIRTIGPRTLRLYPIFHPAAALYTPRMLETLREDFARLPELLALPEPPQPEPPAAEPAVPEPELAAVAARPEPAADAERARAARRGAARPVLGRLRRLVGGDGVALVVAPLAADQQVARGEALEPEAGRARERDRGGVAGLDVGLQPVQRERPEGVRDRLAPSPRACSPCRRGARARSSRGRRDWNAPRTIWDRISTPVISPLLAQAGEQAHGVVAARAREQLVELLRALGRIGPRPVQRAALGGEPQELLAVAPLEQPQGHAVAVRRGGGEALRGPDRQPRAAGPPPQRRPSHLRLPV